MYVNDKMDDILKDIIDYKFIELGQLKKRYKNIKINSKIKSQFKKNFQNTNRVQIIAELKPSSPSEGKIIPSDRKSLKAILKAYNQFPLGAISILTDKKYFNGAFENLALAKEITDKPILCKEFIIDEFQIKLAKYFGADAILLIAETLPFERLLELYRYAKSIHLDVLFELHDSKYLSHLLQNKIDIIGINNRNLSTLKINKNRCLTLKKLIPKNKITIAESGFETKNEISILSRYGFTGVLIGTSLLKAKKIEKKLEEVVYYDK